MKKTIIPLLLSLLFTLIVFFNCVSVLSWFFQIDASMIAHYRYFILTLSYFSILIVLLVERDNLELFNVDRLTLLILSLVGFVRVRLHFPGEEYYRDFSIGLGIALLGVCVLNWNKIPKTNMHWALIGIMSCALFVPLAFIESTQTERYLDSNILYSSNFLIYALRNFLYNVTFVSPFEEVLIRGIFWGQLRKWKLVDSKIFWLQGLLFWLLHFGQILTPITFFITIPILTMVFSILVKYSNQVFPSMISHTVSNTLVPILVYFISEP